MWDPQFAEELDGFRFVRIDLRGYGSCELGVTPFSNHDDVLAVLDHLHIDEAVIVGCSIGGGIAIDVALAAPDWVAGLVLIGTSSPGYEVEPYEPPQWPDLVEAFEAGDLPRVAELDAEIWVVGHGRTRDDVDRQVFDLVVELDRVPIATETKGGRADRAHPPAAS
jgi:pimeloyl-ACP methyl ester carboxylesterase